MTTTCVLIAAAAFVVGAIISFIVTRNGQLVEVTCPKCNYNDDLPFPGITADMAHTLANYYKQSAEDGTAPPIDQDSLSVHFKLPDLKKYFWDIESAVCGKGNINVQTLGMRFYFGRYPALNDTKRTAMDETNNRSNEYANLHTLFLVPTCEENGVAKDFNPFSPDSLYIMNQGNLIPPPWPVQNMSRTEFEQATGTSF